jgi:hypothetical protein
MVLRDLPETAVREVDLLASREGVTSFKMFMAYPGRLMADDGAIVRALRQARELGALVMVHAEDGVAIDALVAEALREQRQHVPRHPEPALKRPPRQGPAAVPHDPPTPAELLPRLRSGPLTATTRRDQVRMGAIRPTVIPDDLLAEPAGANVNRRSEQPLLPQREQLTAERCEHAAPFVRQVRLRRDANLPVA